MATATVTAGVGLTPEVSFEPPTLGTPAAYRVLVIELDDDKDANGNAP